MYSLYNIFEAYNLWAISQPIYLNEIKIKAFAK